MAGYFLDRKVKYWQGLLTVQNQRNPQITEILENTRLLKQEVDDLKQIVKGGPQ